VTHFKLQFLELTWKNVKLTVNLHLVDKVTVFLVIVFTTLPLSCAYCLEIWEPHPPETLRACPWAG
jgi:hypothetical protein